MSGSPCPWGRGIGAVVVLCAAATVAFGQAADQVGIYFGDPSLGICEAESDTFPAFDTAAIVLLNPSHPDIGGWELRVQIDGPAVVAGWHPTGQAVNFLTPPQFLIGLAAPLPAASQVVLAQGPLVVTGPGRVLFSLHPTYVPSLPGEMAYIPFEDKEPLTPLATWTGTPIVAYFNTVDPLCDVDRSLLDFGACGVGVPMRLDVIVTNIGGGFLPVEAAIDSTCAAFRVAAGGDPVLLGMDEQQVITVEFRPPAVGDHACELDLGNDCGTVTLQGSADIPRLSLEPSTVDFGGVDVGSTRSISVTVRNIGRVTFDIQPAVPDSCDFFSLAYVTGTRPLTPGSTARISMRFAPMAAGEYTCRLDLGPGLPDVPMIGHCPSNQVGELVIDPRTVDFGTIPVGNSDTCLVTLSNVGNADLTLHPNLPSPCPSLEVLPVDVPVPLGPGQTTTLTVVFHPEESGSVSCTIGLGIGQPTIPVTGAAIVLSGTLRIQPAALDFGGVAVGSWHEQSVTVINETYSPVTLVPSTGPSPTYFSVTSGAPGVVVSPAGRHVITVKFQPGELGPHTGELSLGGDLPVVPLTGVGEAEVVDWSVGPAALDFGSVYVDGPEVEQSVFVTNNGNTMRQVEFFVVGYRPQFSVSPWGPAWIGPGQTHRATVGFDPDTPGTHAAELTIGDIAVVPLTGTGVVDVPHCFINPTSVEFGAVLVGMSVAQTVYVTNSGAEPLACAPTTDRLDFICSSGAFTLDPGVTRAIEVAFNPTSPGEQICVLDLGESLCARVLLFGEGSAALVPDHDLVGIWFDEQLTTGIRSEVRVGEAVPAWLALINPSASAGVSGWELRLGLGEGLQLVGSEISGEHYNFEEPPEFYVGLATPLPYGPQVLLATLEFLVTDTDVHAVELHPVWRPSLPDRLAYVYGDDFLLNPMYPISGVPSVAWLTAGGSVAVVAPTPTARLVVDRVELRWPRPQAVNDGCHLYRTVVGTETRLTSSPLWADAGEYSYIDDLAGVPAGASIAYSYGVMQGGAEIARSADVTVTLPGATIPVTRLLPNRPNPFNPATEIRFEIARTGPVRLTVYDLAGRGVAELVDDTLPSGPHHVTWRGTDNAGRRVPSGAYYVRLTTLVGHDTRKVMLLK